MLALCTLLVFCHYGPVTVNSGGAYFDVYRTATAHLFKKRSLPKMPLQPGVDHEGSFQQGVRFCFPS